MSRYSSRSDFWTDAFQGMNQGILGALGMEKRKRDLAEERDRSRKSKLDELLLSAGLKNMRLKQGKNLSDLRTGGDVGSILGKLGDYFEPMPQVPNTSITLSQRPYSDIQKAREILQRTPSDYGKAGMAQKVGGSILGLKTGWGPGSKWQLSDEAISEQADARNVLGNPWRVTKRLSYKGGIPEEQVGVSTDELPDPSNVEEGSIYETDDGRQFILQAGEWVENNQ